MLERELVTRAGIGVSALLVAAMSGVCAQACGGSDAAETPDAGNETGGDVGTDGATDGGSVIVLGQPDDHSNVELEKGLSVTSGVLAVGGKLVLTDGWNQRLLIWNAIPTKDGSSPDVIVGQPDIKTITGDPVGPETIYPLYFASGLGSDGTRLLLADTYWHRVLVYGSIPTTTYRSADLELGQPDFKTTHGKLFVESDVAPSPTRMNLPTSVASDGTHVFVADVINNRVLIWNSFPTKNEQPADLVLGQPDLVSKAPNNCGASSGIGGAKCLATPRSVAVSGGRLFVTDAANNRVLIWSTIPTTNQQAADVVLGQPDMTLRGPGAIGAASLKDPQQVATDGKTVAVVDSGNHRVLLWNDAKTSGAPADLVVGQPDFTSGSANHGATTPDATSLATPIGASLGGGKLFVADQGNFRVLVWNTVPTKSFAAADVVIGRPDKTATSIRPIDATATGGASHAFFDGKRFFVKNGQRSLIWDHVPTGPSDPATGILGEPTFDAIPPLTTLDASHFRPGGDVWADAGHVVVIDPYDHRVLIYNGALSNGRPADLVLGQPDFASRVANNGGVSAQSLFLPWAVTSDGTKLVLCDSNNHRVLIWSKFPTTPRAPADLVLGQADMTANQPNEGGAPTLKSLSFPRGVFTDGTRLVVSDNDNHRVLVWKTFPTANHQPADLVIGQPDGTTMVANNGGLGAKSLNKPNGVVLSGDRLYIADTGNHRVLRFNALPAANYAAADAQYGQRDFVTRKPNDGGLSGTTLNAPSTVSIANGALVINDTGNARLLIVPSF